jgi:ectoine hydroxylase-related dioxygenase (phytanoyl-CoA dioxygenase family)
MREAPARSPASADAPQRVAEAYRRDGYGICEGLLGAREVEALRRETAAIVRGERGEIVGKPPADEGGEAALMAEVIAIHHPHKLSPLMRRTMAHPRIVEVLTAIIGPDVKSMQTMLFVKAPGQPGQAWHQDEHFIPTRDRSLCGAWIALDDATVENGCMWMRAGSQGAGVLYPMQPHGEARFDSADEAFGFPGEREGGTPVELKAGGVAFFNGYTLHRSLPNRAKAGFRRALVTHYMSARSLLPWAVPGARDASDVRDIVMIAGEDPYAWRGLEDLALPYLRPRDPERAAAVYAELRRRAIEDPRPARGP